MPRRLRIELKRGNFVLDPLSIFLALMACLIGLVIYIFNVDSFLGSRGLFVTMATMVGLVFGTIILKSKVSMTLDTQEMSNIAIWSMIGFICIVFLQTIMFQVYNLASVGWYNKIFYGSVGIAEEFLFRFAILQFLYQYFRNIPSALFVSSISTSVIFTTYHLVVYGAMPIALLAVFVSSMILCIITILSNRISVPILSHMLVNIIASA